MVTDRLVSTYTVIYTTQIEGSIVVPPPPQVIEIIFNINHLHFAADCELL